MRICLVTHGFPPLERTGVENYTAALAAVLAEAGHTVEVFAPRRAEELPDLSMRREERNAYGLNWISTNTPPRDQEEQLDPPGIAERFGEFLDRERPEIVHFQHLIKLGTGLLAQAEARGIPTVYTAHDYYAVCHRFTLMKPDLSRCDTVGDPALCARCDLALSYLNQREGLGDYQQGALPDQLGEKGSAALAGILEGAPRKAGFTKKELTGFVERRTALDARRLETFRRFDRIVSPTRFLAERLVEGGLEADRIEHLPYGAETGLVAQVPALRALGRRRLRIGYLGGMSKHKGVHVLVDAFERMEEKAELSIWGDSSDAPYVSRIAETAARAGAQWRGPFRRDALARCLADVDVVVVPSIWVENYPFVVREAFAAGRPVVASDVGALGESVRHEVDGLLFEVGDADALAAALDRLVAEKGLLKRLAKGIEPVKGIEEQAAELVPLYEELRDAARPSETADLPRSLVEPARRYEELASLPLRRLFRLVLDRLGDVGSTLTGKEPDPLLPADVLAEGSETQVLLRDLKREKIWLKGSVISSQKTVEALEERLGWREKEIAAKNEEIAWLQQSLEDAKSAASSLSRETDWLNKLLEGKATELDWLRETVSSLRSQTDAHRKEISWLRETLEAKKAAEQGLQEELAWLRENVDSSEAGAEAHLREIAWLRDTLDKTRAAEEANQGEMDWLRESLADRKEETEAHLQEIEWLRETLANYEAADEAHRKEVGWLRETIAAHEETEEARMEELAWVRENLSGKEAEVESQRRENEWLRETVAQHESDADAQRNEIEWLKEVVATHESEGDSRERERKWLRDSLLAHEKDLAWLEEKRRVLEEKSSSLAEEKAEHEARAAADLAAERKSLERALSLVSRLAAEALRPHQEALGDPIATLRAQLEHDDGSESVVAAVEAHGAAVERGNRELHERLRELAERRREMDAAASEARRRLVRLVLGSTGLGRRVAGWTEPGNDAHARGGEESR
jgi:glycosyltransferase involved in cell wall biosynthesis/chromosome segregation ATPase